jgi:hypothetical protein
MNTTKNAKPRPAGLWPEMDRADFDASAPLTLFDLTEVDNSMNVRPDDKCGTPDLFSDQA